MKEWKDTSDSQTVLQACDNSGTKQPKTAYKFWESLNELKQAFIAIVLAIIQCTKNLTKLANFHANNPGRLININYRWIKIQGA